MAARPRLNLAVCGPLDGGKSSLAGAMAFKLGGIDQRTVERLERDRLAGAHGFAFNYATLLDRNLRSEREREVQSDLRRCRAQTPRFDVTMIDAPGHTKFIKNQISALAQADSALLVVPACQGEFEAALGARNRTGRESWAQSSALDDWVRLIVALGLRRVVVAVNKMNDGSVAHAEERYLAVMAAVKRLFHRAGMDPGGIEFVPLSAAEGTGIVERDPAMRWYRGPSLVEALDAFNPPAASRIDKPLRMPLVEANRIGGIGTVVCGRVATGSARTSTPVVLMPGGHVGSVMSVEQDHSMVDAALPGGFVGVCVTGLPVRSSALRRGMVLCGFRDQPLEEARCFEARISLLHHPGEVRVGYCPLVCVAGAAVACRITSLLRLLDNSTGAVLDDAPARVRAGEVFVAQLEPLKPLCVEPIALCPRLARIVLLDNGKLVGVGVVQGVNGGAPVAGATAGALTKSARKR